MNWSVSHYTNNTTVIYNQAPNSLKVNCKVKLQEAEINKIICFLHSSGLQSSALYGQVKS